MEKKELIQSLINQTFLHTKKVIKAFEKVPRENFIPEKYKEHAYADIPLPISAGQTISAPHMVAVMTEALDVKDKEKILEIGAGSGYQAAILSVLNPDGKIYTIEIIPEVAQNAKEVLKDYKNVIVIQGDGSLGLESEKPFDRIIATCGCPSIPRPWIEQLKEKGKILAPVGGMYEQELILVEKIKEKIKETNLNFPCVFVPLRGKYGWK